MKLLSALCLVFFASTSFASGNNKVVTPIILQPEPVEMVMLCPDNSQHEGELIPKWVTSDEAIEFFCNDSEEIEIAE
ncbi:MAG: hypothetical protein AB8B92_00710 [Gammaproteobacteria bacterium]